MTQLSAKLVDENNKFIQSANQKDAEVTPEQQQKPDEHTQNKPNTPNANVSNNGSTTKPSNPIKTGDEAPISVLLLMLAVSAAAFGTAVYKKNRQQMK